MATEFLDLYTELGRPEVGLPVPEMHRADGMRFKIERRRKKGRYRYICVADEEVSQYRHDLPGPACCDWDCLDIQPTESFSEQQLDQTLFCNLEWFEQMHQFANGRLSIRSRRTTAHVLNTNEHELRSIMRFVRDKRPELMEKPGAPSPILNPRTERPPTQFEWKLDENLAVWFETARAAYSAGPKVDADKAN